MLTKILPQPSSTEKVKKNYSKNTKSDLFNFPSHVKNIVLDSTDKKFTIQTYEYCCLPIFFRLLLNTNAVK